MDGLHDTPHIFPIYAAPIISAEDPIDPMPWWFKALLHRPSPMFLNLVETACTLDDWGVAADLLRYRTLDEEVNSIELQISCLERDRAAADHTRIICESCLEVSHCSESLAYLESLAPKPSRAGHDKGHSFQNQTGIPSCKHLHRGRQ